MPQTLYIGNPHPSGRYMMSPYLRMNLNFPY